MVIATDVSEPTPLVGQPRLLATGVVCTVQRLSDGYQEVSLFHDWGVFEVAPIEYDISPGDAIAVYGDGQWVGGAISHVRINDGPPTPQHRGYVELYEGRKGAH